MAGLRYQAANDDSKPGALIRLPALKKPGTQIVHFAAPSNTGAGAIQRSLSGFKGNRQYSLCFHGLDFRFQDVGEGQFAVFILRDPISRFQSSFHKKKARATRATAMTRFEHPNDLALALDSADGAQRTIAEDAMRELQQTDRPYTELLGPLKALKIRADRILFVGFKETLERDFEALRSVLDAPASLRLTLPPRPSPARSKTKPASLSRRAKQILGSWYAADYEIIAYVRALMERRRPAYCADETLTPGAINLHYQLARQ